MNSENTSSSGISLAGMLGILFIGLKLTKFIDWSWWWVLAPFWIPASIALVCLLILAIMTTRQAPQMKFRKFKR
jgi:MFS family permease